MTTIRGKKRPAPQGSKDPDAFAHDQQRDAPDGIVRGKGVSDHRMRMPHERDEAPDAGKTGTDEAVPAQRHGMTPRHGDVPQAAEDVERGLVDTERRGVPSQVPSSKDNRES